MARPLLLCQCRKWTATIRACKRVATAEDLLCDICRTGCRRATFGSGMAIIPHVPSPAADYRARVGAPPPPYNLPGHPHRHEPHQAPLTSGTELSPTGQGRPRGRRDGAEMTDPAPREALTADEVRSVLTEAEVDCSALMIADDPFWQGVMVAGPTQARRPARTALLEAGLRCTPMTDVDMWAR